MSMYQQPPSVGRHVLYQVILFCTSLVVLYPVLWVVKIALTPSQGFSMDPWPFPCDLSGCEVSMENFDAVINTSKTVPVLDENGQKTGETWETTEHMLWEKRSPAQREFQNKFKVRKKYEKSAKDKFPKSAKKVCKMYELKIEQNQSAQKVHEKYTKSSKVHKKCTKSVKKVRNV